MFEIAEEAKKLYQEELAHFREANLSLESIDENLERLGKEKEELNKRHEGSGIVEQNVGDQEDPQEQLQNVEADISFYKKKQEDLTQLEIGNMAAERLEKALKDENWSQLRSPFNFGD